MSPGWQVGDGEWDPPFRGGTTDRDRRRILPADNTQDALSPCAPLRVSGAEQGGFVLRRLWRDPVRLRGLRDLHEPGTVCPISCAKLPLVGGRSAPLPGLLFLLARACALAPAASHRTARDAVFRLGLRDWPVPPPLARPKFKKKSFCRQATHGIKACFLKILVT